MKSLEALIEHLKTHETVLQYKKLEARVQKHPKYLNEYASLLKKQKHMVKLKHAKSPQYDQALAEYEKALSAFTKDPLLHQYLTLKSEVNDLVKSITTTLETIINAPLET